MANKKIIPAISVIIPMYNAEKYIGECLDSIFAQTFSDYEVIVVDDRSTDKSCEVVENYLEKFDGRLQLIKSEKNSGGAGVPRNIGIKISRGEYIFLMDSDDAITPTAFEEFYKLGKEFDADVVYSKRHYVIGAEEKSAHLRKNFPIQVVDNQKVEEKLTLETEDLAQRIQQMCNWQFNLTAHGNFIKRNLVVVNEITFPNTKFYEDFAFIFKVQCLAKKFVHTPKPIYFYRLQPDSITHKKNKTLEQTLDFWITSLTKGLDDLNNFMDKLEFFQKNVHYRYAVFDHLANFIFRPLLNICYQIPPFAIYSAILQGEVKKFSENKNLIAYLLSTVNNQQKFLFNANQKISELQTQLNKNQQEIFLPNEKTSSAISVIIPMYNAEKYIGECLDSILAQTFSDYEVIVVDDCSTDKSCEVVENYLEKFDGRLQLIKSEKNSGGCPGTPRNIGIKISRGKYLMFVDADDAITSTALEELYNSAENFSADVVHCEKFYRAAGETVTTDKNFLTPLSLEQKNFVTQPTFMSDELADRINEFGTDKFWVVPWNIFLRRDLIANNNLNFPEIRSGEDLIFGFFILCKAKKILRVPNVCYVWRNNQNSFTWAKMSEEKMIHRWCDSLFRGLKILDDFMANFELFKKNPEYKYQVFELLIKNHTVHIIKLYDKMPAAQLDGLIRRELEQVKDKNALTSFIFSRMSSLNINFLKQNQIIQNQQSQIQQLANGMNALAHNEQIKIFLREKFHNLIQKYSTIMPDEKFEPIPSENYRIFVCWLQGEKNLPPIIQCCYNSLKMNAGDYKICFIDEKNFSDYVELPEYILKKFREGKITRVHFSDILRANLLEKYGGLWIDSTVLVTEPLEKHKNLLEKPFYTQKICQTKDMQNEFVRTMGDIVYVTYARWSSFLQGSSILHNPLFTFAKDFYNEYWQKFDELISYFLIDFMMDIAYEKIPFVKNEMDAVPINNPDIYDLLRHLNDKYSAYPYEQILAKNFFHKLSYKDPVNYQDKENVLNAILKKYF